MGNYNEDLLYQEIERRRHICNGECELYKPEYLCDNYKYCDRAYKEGCHNQILADFGE